jgi:hypothetical protein
MFSLSLSQAFEAATPAACKALIAQGINFIVAVENEVGEWMLLHADDQAHASTLAHHWVDTMGARGTSCWRIFNDGPAPRAFATVFAQPEWED